ncbi:MAG: HAD-IC family P-type ATPase, partial [Flavobacteriales bacterium]|nr:HAD-IC family P-type ATPase [Flavobacteriales bacterium]
TIAVLTIAEITAIVWVFVDVSRVWEIVSAVLIVACPCALALSIPFAFGHMSRFLGKDGMFLRHVNLLDKLSRVTDIVLDKTGTLTMDLSSDIQDETSLNQKNEYQYVKSAASHSQHPLSRSLFKWISTPMAEDIETKEVSGLGVHSIFKDGTEVKIGHPSFVDTDATSGDHPEVHVSINGEYRGKFVIQQSWRPGLKTLIQNLKTNYNIHLLTGDHNGFEEEIKEHLGIENAHFRQKPADKLNYIKSLQKSERTVLMLGDGLNDSGALKQSDVGVAIAKDETLFTPSSDAILKSSSFDMLAKALVVSKLTRKVIWLSLTVSIIYNVVGLYFAISGQLTPVVAAILMPLSSISVVVLVTLCTSVIYKRNVKN